MIILIVENWRKKNVQFPQIKC